jgi:hypothetical protein
VAKAHVNGFGHGLDRSLRPPAAYLLLAVPEVPDFVAPRPMKMSAWAGGFGLAPLFFCRTIVRLATT